MPTTFDIYIRGGTVIDGTGAPGFAADVGVVGDRITYIGPGITEAERLAREVISAEGMALSPGFIDIHTHADIALLSRPAHLPKIMQGVTTEVFTNCGLGFAPVTNEALAIQRQYLGGLFGVEEPGHKENTRNRFGSNETASSDTNDEESTHSLPPSVSWNWRTVADFLAQFESQGIGANIVYLVPHGALRVSAMGMANRAATPEEVETMRAMLAQGLEEGAWGLSTGVWYAPMDAADRAELVTLCRTAGFFATHQRDYGDRIFEATEESLAIAHEANAKLQIAHLQLNGPNNAGRAPELLARLDRARRDGLDVTCDTYPYTAGSTLIQALLPAWATEGGPEAILSRLADGSRRDQILETLQSMTEKGTDWSRYVLVGATSPGFASQEGETFTEAARSSRLSLPEWIVAVMQAEELRACFVHHAAHEGNVRDVLQWRGQMVGSDGLHLPGKTHPRLYGTFPRVLGRYVRDERVLPLEVAVHKMTGMPAVRLGLKRRGSIALGNAADLVVFDPETICDRATFDDPLRFPEGIPFVAVNGQIVKRDGQPTMALPGRVLRR